MANYWSSSSATLPVLAPQPSHPSDFASSGAPTPSMRDRTSHPFVSASFGAPPLPTRPPPFHFENLNASSPAGARPTVTLQLIDRVQGQGVAASGNQQNGTSSYENTQLQLGRTLPEEFFDMIKKLAQWDVDRRQCRLLLPQHFGKHIFSMNKKAADQCSSTDSFPIDVLDVEDNCSFELLLKHWPSANSYVLAGRWIQDFVIRKGLKKDDNVGLTYHGSKLYFKHFKNHN